MNNRDTPAADEPLDDEAAATDQVMGGGAAADDEARAELAETKDRVLRLQAELENVRKRSQRELQDAARYAGMPLMRDLLPVLDNVERALEAAEQGSENSGLMAGVRMVANQLREVLARHHCQHIDALHQPFDPHVHEAISQQPSVEVPPGSVLLVVQSGYQLHDRVVRPAQVIVSTAPPENNQ